MAASAETTADLAIPPLDVRALARRAAVPAALAAAAAAALVLAGGPLRTFADALGRALDADPRWVIAGGLFELLSFVGYIAVLWMVGSRAHRRLDLRASMQLTLGGAAATRLLPTGGAGGAALTLWAIRRTGLSPRAAARTLLAFLVLIYAVFLSAIAVSGGLLALGITEGHGPLLLSAVPAAAATVAIAAGLVMAARHGGEAEPATGAAAPLTRTERVRATMRSTPPTLGGAIRDAIGFVRSADPRLLGAPAWWGFDIAVLWAMLHAFGTAPPFTVVVLGYFVGQIANTIPIPGAVSGGMVGILLAFGVAPDLALTSVLAYRALAIWLPAPVGLAALNPLRRTLDRWRDEDAAAAASAATVLPLRPAHAEHAAERAVAA